MRAHRSHSQLHAYLECGHRYYLQRVLHRPEDPCVWFPGGKAFHSTTEGFDRAWWINAAILQEAWEDQDARNGWLDLFTDSFEMELDENRRVEPDERKWRVAGKVTLKKPDKENIPWWHENGRQMVSDYIDWWQDNRTVWEIAAIDGKPAIEVEVSSEFDNSGVMVKAYVDRVLRSKVDQRLVVADLKSGSRTPSTTDQLGGYSVQLEKMMGEPVLWGAYYNARMGRLGDPIDLTKWTEPRLGRIYTMLDKGIDAGIFIPNVDEHCKRCGVAKFCEFNGGREDAAA